MGLLSNPQQRKKIVNTISKYNNALCLLCYVVGVTWFLALAYQPLNARTYFSENALLPGVVESGFFFEFDSSDYLSQLKAELRKDKSKVPREWIYDKFREIGLDVYVQNYSIKYPLNIVRGQLVPGQNVYAILRARRAASTEAIVVSTPLRPKNTDFPQTIGGIVMMMGLARYFRRQPYWSKDIIFLMTDHEQIGMQAWLDGYHQVDAHYIQSGELPGRSGAIQAALNLEVPDGKIGHYDLKIEGLNGQLPNLDLVNLVVRLCRKHGAELTLHHKRDSRYDGESVEGFRHTLGTMVRMMWAQATGMPSGNHGLFHRYHIEAVTLEAVRRKKSGLYGLETTGKIVEGICRSLNNLLERFHQSFFFYILPATERYISIGLYMPPFGILCATCLVKAIYLWVSRQTDKPSSSDGSGKEKDERETDGTGVAEDGAREKEAGKEKLSKERLDELVHEETEDPLEDEGPTGTITVIPILFSSLMMAILCYTGPDLLSNMAVPFQMNIEDGIFYGFLALFTASLMFPRMVARKTSDEKKLAFDWKLLKSVALIAQTLVLFSLSLLNISLAFFLAVIMVPVSIMVHPTHNRLSRWVQKLLLLLVSPLAIMFAAALLLMATEKHETYLELLVNSWNAIGRGLLLSMVDRFFFGSWLFALFSFAILPNWLTLWGISFCEVI